MKRALSVVVVVGMVNLVFPMQLLAAGTPEVGKVSTTKAAGSVAVEYESGRIQWKLVFSPGGSDVSHEVEFEVKGQETHLLMSITNLEDPTKNLEKVRIEAVDPGGKRIGQARDQFEEARRLGLKSLPENEAAQKVQHAIAAHRIATARAGKAKSGVPFNPKQVVGERALNAAVESITRDLKRARNAGILYIADPASRFQGRGFNALNLFNPSKRGEWKMNVEGKRSEPFVAVAMVLPIELTDADQKEIHAAGKQLMKELKEAFPEYQGWGTCDACCQCQGVVWATGAVATLIGAAATLIGLAGGWVAVIAACIGLICAAVGVWMVSVAVAWAIVLDAFGENWWCALINFAPLLCYVINAGCGYPC